MNLFPVRHASGGGGAIVLRAPDDGHAPNPPSTS